MKSISSLLCLFVAHRPSRSSKEPGLVWQLPEKKSESMEITFITVQEFLAWHNS